ncbi:bifunctional DNA primase/polymerase [Streptomyces sp. NPDC018045]|uniref:bifunctional DNA primase/polymerase n=1 Tax=unclassified Streptomyces TaxID=2593676 RepID=UPI0037AEDD10
MQQVERVLDLAAHGLYVFPLRPNDKRPAVSDWQQRATTDPHRIERAWSAGAYGVGIACGPSGLVVIDLDTAKGATPPDEWKLPGIVDGADVFAELHARHGARWPFGATPSVRTASGGMHLYYRAPAGREVRNSAGRLGWKIDVRAAGGYVVAPPSPVAGSLYRWETGPGVAPIDLPEWLAALAAPRAEQPLATVQPLPFARRNQRGYAAAALLDEVDKVRTAVPGTRNDTLHRAAFNLGTLAGRGDLAPAEIVDHLFVIAVAVGLGPTETEKTITSGLRAGMLHPRGAAA